MRLSSFAILIAAIVLRVPAGAGPAPTTGAFQPAVPRLVAIGDLHADINQAKRAFRLAGATDASGRWIGGNLVVVQMGDLIGRGPEDREVLDFVLDLQRRAKEGGGTIHALIGNHEVFAARPDHRWVNPEAFAAFSTIAGLNLREPRFAAMPAPERPRAVALMPGSRYARQLSAFPAVLKIGRTVFSHAGVLPHWARYGIERLNTEVSDWFAGRTGEPLPTLGLDDGSSDDGVMWSRHFGAAPEEVACPIAQESLTAIGAERMVVAHTVQKLITERCGGRLWAIDVGISKYYGGQLQVLEILNDRDLRVIQDDSR